MVAHQSVLGILWDFHAPKHDTEQNKLCLVAVRVSQMPAAMESIPSAVSLKVWPWEFFFPTVNLSPDAGRNIADRNFITQ